LVKRPQNPGSILVLIAAIGSDHAVLGAIIVAARSDC
jgi:tRNA A22 N-methylase